MATLPTVNPVPLPLGDPIAESRKPFKGSSLSDVISYLRGTDRQGFLTQTWLRYLSQQSQQLAVTSTRINLVELEAQGASISATDFSNGDVAAGYYEVKPYATVVTVAGVSSSLILTIAWTDGGVSKSKAYAAYTTNTTGSIADWPPFLIRADSSSPITYATTYASNAAGVMKYDLSLTLSRVAVS